MSRSAPRGFLIAAAMAVFAVATFIAVIILTLVGFKVVPEARERALLAPNL